MAQISTPQVIQLQSLLMDLEVAMRSKGLWAVQPPSVDAFASEQPFCVDTMEFSDWLQFVFVSRLQFLIEQQQPLPTQCGIAPYAEMFWQGRAAAMTDLLQILRDIDRLLTVA